MQQEPVHKDNKKFRKLLRGKISIRWNIDEMASGYWIKQIEDYLLPTVIYNFYSQKETQNFQVYLEEIDLRKENYHEISEVIDNYLEVGKACPANVNGKILGDAHPAGATKCLSNNVIKYSKYPDYGDLLSSLAVLIFPDFEKFFPQIIKKGDSFERKYVQTNLETNDIEDIREYYFNLGRIIPFLLILRAIDINAENITINLPYPVFFDMETIFSGKLDGERDGYGIENTGIVKIGTNDSSVLTGGITERDSLLKPLICGNSRKPYIGWRTKSTGVYENIPSLNGKRINPIEYIENIHDGYKDGIIKFFEKKKEIMKMVQNNDAIVRVIIRPTRMYRLFVLKSCYPQIYTKQSRGLFLEESLKDCGYIHKLEAENLIKDEVCTMLNLQIPVYYAKVKEKEIFSSSGEIISNWGETLYEVWRNYMGRVNERFFLKQWGIIEKSIS